MLRQVSNPPSPYLKASIDWLGDPPKIEVQVFEEEAKSILSSNSSPDIGFNYSVNPYRGCFHGCAYCYARPTHQYLDFGAGTDFERKLVAKINAPELLEQEFNRPRWKGERVVFSGVTDCYQPLEATYELTRRCLEVALRFRNPISIITKGALVQRDVDILARLAREASVQVNISLAFADDALARKIEPYAPSPSARLRAMKTLADAGIPVGVGVAPAIPGLNEEQIPTILTKAAEAGATSAFLTLLRLPAEVKEVFEERLLEAVPARSKRVMEAVKELKGGVLNRSEFGKRMTGDGARWDAIRFLFDNTCRKLGLNERGRVEGGEIRQTTFRRPKEQLSLF